MSKLELITLFTIASLAIDKFLAENLAKKILNTILVGGLVYAESVNLILALPLGLGLLLYWFNFKLSPEKLKQIAVGVVAFSMFQDQFWKVLVLCYMHLLTMRFIFEHKKVSAILMIDKIYSFTFLLLGLFLIWMNRDISSALYLQFQLPVGVCCLLLSLFKSFNILGSLKVMNIQSLGLPIGSKIVFQLVQNYYIPLQLVFVIKDQTALLGSEQIYWLSLIAPLILLASAMKHIYEIKISQRKVPHDALMFHYYCALFFGSAIFIEGALFQQILIAVAYILVIYSALVVLSTKTIRGSVKAVLVLLLLPTPLSFTFYQGLKIYNQLIFSNFTLMSSTFILMIVGSFLLRPELFGKYKLANE